MTGTIKVSTAELTKAAGSFQEAGNQVKNLTTEMTTLVNELTGAVWSGDAATAYKNKFSELQDDINRMIGMITEHVNDLTAMAREFERVEDVNINLANSLSGDVII